MKMYEIGAIKRYFKQALIDMEITNNLEEKKVIAKNIETKLDKYKAILTDEELTEILMMFTDSEAGKKRIRERNTGKEFKESVNTKFTVKNVKVIGTIYKLVNSLTFEIETPSRHGDYTFMDKLVISGRRVVL